MTRFFSLTIFAVLLLSTQNCADTSIKKDEAKAADSSTPAFTTIKLDPEFNNYWYAGLAELCTYDVVQSRYGEIRDAEQVNIFVTEDFSASKQVKLDNPTRAGDDRVPVLKLNALRRFETGIYDYSIMQSVFTPVSGAPTLKSTASIQDWCGQVFMQSNLVPAGYQTRVFSYFESEGDQDITLPQAMLEDEIWAKIRLNPASIPVGPVKVIPSAVYGRLRHKENAVQTAVIALEKGVGEQVLSLRYESIPRMLQVRFEDKFPYKILGWEETVDGQLASKGTLKATRRSAYWAEHDNVHAPLRDSLKLGIRD